jgi:hypothetical protein
MQLGTLSDQEDCARALGLRGAEAQVAVNTTGSLRLKQITMPHAMKHPLQHLVCYSTTNDKCVLEIYSYPRPPHSNLADSTLAMSWPFCAIKSCRQWYIITGAGRSSQTAR